MFNSQNNIYRVVACSNTNQQFVCNSTLTKDVAYQKATEVFLQWRDTSKVYGLFFQQSSQLDSFVSNLELALDKISGDTQKPPPQTPLLELAHPQHLLLEQTLNPLQHLLLEMIHRKKNQRKSLKKNLNHVKQSLLERVLPTLLRQETQILLKHPLLELVHLRQETRILLLQDQTLSPPQHLLPLHVKIHQNHLEMIHQNHLEMNQRKYLMKIMIILRPLLPMMLLLAHLKIYLLHLLIIKMHHQEKPLLYLHSIYLFPIQPFKEL